MPDVVVQASFNAGEWSPALFARVDMQKWRSAAALLENFYVDYRGGASTRPGSAYIIQCLNSANAVRLIPFQATSTVGYVIEFGNFYARFIFDGGMITENPFSVTGASKANPCVIQVPGNNFNPGEIIFVNEIDGMTQLNDRYYAIVSVAGAAVTLDMLNGVNVDSTTYSTYTSGGIAARVYTISTPYAAADLAKLKFAQNISQMILCHPSYQPYVLQLNSAANWSLTPLTIGSQATAPSINSFTTNLTSSAPTVDYAYVVTSVDGNGEESSPSGVFQLVNLQDMRVTAGTIQITWDGIGGAQSYNVYKADASYAGTVPSGSTFGFIGQATGTSFADTNIGPDYTQTPPIAQNPFIGSGIASITVTSAGTYTNVPSVIISGSATLVASASATLTVQGTPTVGSGGSGYAIGDRVTFSNNVVLVVATLSGSAVATWQPASASFSSSGAVTSGSVPTNPVSQIATSGAGSGATANLTWGVGMVTVNNPGSGYSGGASISFSSGGAAATANISNTAAANPSVPSFFQERLVLAGTPIQPQTFWMSQPGNFFNFNTSSPVKADDAVSGTLVSGVLNSIKAIVSSTSGMLILTDKASWIVNGGAAGVAITPSALVASAQSFTGANDVPPIIANYDVLYVQEKGSSVRDLAFNIYFNLFTGTDISIVASHLFFGYQILEWAWAEEPFKVVWAVRSDGAMITLTFLKEQDFCGWSHQITLGNYESVAAITEASTTTGFVDAVYTVVERNINNVPVKYIERIADRLFPNGRTSAWCVDAGLQYSGAATINFSGGEHLAGQTVTGLADGQVITPFTMPASGLFTLPAAASFVTVGLGYTCKLQTLPLDIGEPSIQGKVKKINAVNVRVNQTLGLSIGASFDKLTPMKDLVVGNVSSTLTGQSNQIITDLVSGDAKTILNPTYTVPGQYCIQQSLPYPATVLGLFPQITLGDDSAIR